MSAISEGIGHNIRVYRKKNNLTLDKLAELVCKSKSTLSKYEKGEISVDIETLYDLADALHIHVEQLLYARPARTGIKEKDNRPAFFHGVQQFYSYIYDGRSRTIMESVFDIQSQTAPSQYNIMMYMNILSFESYQNCETTYYGYIEHYDAVTNILLTNQYSPMEKASAQMLASYLDADRKWGLWNGLSSRPLMPIAAKMLFTRKRVKKEDPILDHLKISKDDIRRLKLYNMLPVV